MLTRSRTHHKAKQKREILHDAARRLNIPATPETIGVLSNIWNTALDRGVYLEMLRQDNQKESMHP